MEELDAAYMRLAIKQAYYSKQTGDVPFGAVIVQNGIIIATAYNSEHTDQDVTMHAEVKAIRQASQHLHSRDLSDCTLYSSSEPCTMCTGAIFNSCMQRVVYGASRDDLPHLFRERAMRMQHLAGDWHYKPEIVSGILREEAVDAFMEYTQAFRVTHKVAVRMNT